MTPTLVLVPLASVKTTLATLRAAGRRKNECVVLWCGRRKSDQILVEDVYVPKQESSGDFFRIPPTGMTQLMAYLRQSERMIAAQVHSHPMEAFHSHADDTWAIVRHVGALSLVLPYFAVETTEFNFTQQLACFALNEHNVWNEVPRHALSKVMQVLP